MTPKTILLVEDNPDDEALTLRAFERNKIQNTLVVVRDGQEALDYLFGEGKYVGRDLNDRPEIVLLDLQLPKMSGQQVLKEIRAREETRSLPVVVLTTSSEEGDILSSYNNGANSYVRKPVDFSEFMEAVKQLGMYWLLINTPPPR